MNTPDHQLQQLLLSLYSPDELRRFISNHTRYTDLANQLPGAPATPTQLAEALTTALKRRGLLGRQFFFDLETSRPHRARDIQNLASSWPASSDISPTVNTPVSKLQRLQQLLLATHPDSGRLLWTLQSLSGGNQLLAEISDFDKQRLGSLARRAISEIDRQPRYIQPLFIQLLSDDPDRRDEIAQVAQLWGIELPTNPAATKLAATSADTPKSTQRPDVAVLIALREEFRVFCDILATKRTAERDWKYGGYLYRFSVPSPAAPYKCIALFIDDMGPEEATLAASRLLDHDPAVIVNLGIAGSLSGDLLLGDVAVADQVDAYLAKGKAVADGEGWTFEFGGQAYRGSHRLIADASNLEFAEAEVYDAWRDACRTDFERLLPEASKREEYVYTNKSRDVPALVKTHVASGPTVAASKAFAAWVRSRDRKLGALEMEAAGMMLAAHRRAEPARTLVLRGISDFCDGDKSSLDGVGKGAFRKLAMGNAVRLLEAMMRAGMLPRSG